MVQQAIRKTFKYKRRPTPEQEWMIDRTLTFCRHVYSAAIGERREAWRLRGVSVAYHQQKAELPGITEVMPEYGEVHSQVLQEVVQRVDRAFHAFFRSPARCALAAAFWSRKAYPFVGMLVRTADKSAPGPQRRRGRVAWAASENRESLPGVSMSVNVLYLPIRARWERTLCGGPSRLR